MPYADVIEGLIERFEDGLSGFAKYDENGKLVNILDYEPAALHTVPTIYLLLDSFESASLPTIRYRILARLCVLWQDNEFAEQELIPYVNSLVNAVRADPKLNHRLDNGGLAKVADGKGTWVDIGDVLYRSLDVFVDVLEKWNN